MDAPALASLPLPVNPTTPRVSEPDSALPEVPRHPAPWQLGASAYLFVVWMPEQVLDKGSFVPPALVSKRRSRASIAMLVDYHTAPCGPYSELLVVPAAFAFDEGKYMSITRIFVSTYDSVVNGRANWGIPKDRADFSYERDEQGADHVRVARAGTTIAEFDVRPVGPTLPVTTSVLPSGVRELMQHWNGQSYNFALKASGSVRMAKLRNWRFDPLYFPDLAQGRVLAAMHFPEFQMTFPVAQTKPL